MTGNPQESCKKRYQKPSLRVYGDIRRITETTRTVTNARDNSGMGGLNKTN
jgi:hypothetical protein